ncbi:hypothetical protein ACFQ1S_10895 [Kibdelosporangium lantanae]|uniref:Uncharacterized protein n=1 Tax=Kibdelosporangium lantanae TaxID=1497396 RepID=A0ABW3M7P0_9PSEU
MTDDPGWRRKVLLVVVSAILGAVLGRLVTTRPQAFLERPVLPPAPPAVVERSVEQPRRVSSAVYCVLVSLLLLFGVWSVSRQQWLLGEIAGTMALLVVAVALRGPAWRRGRWASGVLVALMVVGAPFELVLNMSQMPGSTADVNGLLLQMGLFIIFIGVFAWLTASWRMAILAEVGALLLIALMLGFVSFSALSYFTVPVSTPQSDGAALALYADSPASEMSVDVTMSPHDRVGTTEMSLRVRFTGGVGGLRWGIVLFGGLRFLPGHGISLDGLPVNRNDSAAGYQILSGFGTSEYEGVITGSFEASSASRSVASLPSITSGSLPDRFHDDLPDIMQSVGFSLFKPLSAAISVDCGTLDPLKTVTQASPPLQEPNQLSWRAQDKLGPITYATLDQGKEDRSRNVLFVVAILLGAAVACLVAALQAALKAAHMPG